MIPSLLDETTPHKLNFLSGQAAMPRVSLAIGTTQILGVKHFVYMVSMLYARPLPSMDKPA